MLCQAKVYEKVLRAFTLSVALIALFSLLTPYDVMATTEYSARSGQSCLTCHQNAEGGTLTAAGLEYSASGYVWPPEGGYRILGPIKKSVRLVLGILHVLASFLWFGTILYVHILLRPAYAEKGLPKGEVILGLTSMTIVGITGVLLTISRIKSLQVLFTSPWGIVLSIKILLYAIMIFSAFVAVFFVGPRLRKAVREAILPKGVFDPLTLSAFDGKNKRPAFIAFKGKVYDMSGLKLWRDGLHMKHPAGTDLSDAIAKAPHKEEKLEGVKMVGAYDATLKPPKTPAQKAFYFIAYMNLIIVFLVLITIGIWRWGL